MSLPYDTKQALAILKGTDAPLAALIDRVGPYRLELRTAPNPFQALMRSIVYQQLSGKAAATIYGRVLDLFPGDALPHPEHILDTPDAALRGAGLSRTKVKAVNDLAAKTLDGIVPGREALHVLEDEAIIERLTAVYGVGRWTVEMLLIFYLGRPDVLPVTDLGVRKGFMHTYALDDLPSPSDLRAHGRRWTPYRSVASWYLWRAADTEF